MPCTRLKGQGMTDSVADIPCLVAWRSYAGRVLNCRGRPAGICLGQAQRLPSVDAVGITDAIGLHQGVD